MREPADPAGCDELSEPERDVMVASLLGVTPDRLRTMRRIQSKRVRGDARVGRARRWLAIDQLDDHALSAAVRRRDVRARAVAPNRVLSPVDRVSRRTNGLR